MLGFYSKSTGRSLGGVGTQGWGVLGTWGDLPGIAGRFAGLDGKGGVLTLPLVSLSG